MASDTVKINEDAEMAECDEDKVVTMMDVLQEQQDFEEDANAVLGASDDKNCTYAKGYIKRQAIYACLTCCPDVKTDPSKRAGVCLACSLNCHENHDLVELYTKRNFRCDCGNPKFNSHPCQFTPSKPDLNDENIYNQNFSGLYCTCKRPYPDPESNSEDDMIQCIICEDWLHASHLDAIVPPNDQYSEMICKGCMSKNEFLHDYTNLAVNVESPDVDVLTVNDNENSISNGDTDKVTLLNGQTSDSLEAVQHNGDDVEMGDKDKDESEVTDQVVSNTEGQVEKESIPEEPSEDIKKDNESTTEQNLEDNKDKEKQISEQKEQEPSSEQTKCNDSNECSSSDSVADENKDEENNSDKLKDKEETNEHTPITEEKPASESSNSDEPKKSEEKEDKIDNADDKTDAVMDAIDELLKEPADITESTKDKNSEKPNETLSATENVNETDIQNNDNMEKDIETSDSKSQDNIENENNIDTQENGDNVTKENTNETEPLANGNEDVNADVESPDTSDSKMENVVASETENVNEDSTNENAENKECDITESTKENKRKHSIELVETKSPKKAKFDIDACIRPRNVKKFYRGATFWPFNFRQKLCTCNSCLSVYKDLHVLFLTDSEDTVSAYESLGKENVEGVTSQYEKGLQALSSLDRIQQINALTEYNRMRDKLLDFLKSFKDRKEIVKEEDIKAFFAGMKPKREPDGVYFCR